ncbi:MAG: YdbC family protein [Myxococcales bacterium]|nr:YdbC family protein [Myxococcales bacterium]
MLIKLIECTVAAASRPAFSRAQGAWDKLSYVPGFMGQLGGWDATRPELARIVGLWRDRGAYRAFMDGPHDRIYDGAGQARTYAASRVRLFESRLAMPGVFDDLPTALASGRAALLRTALCEVAPARQASFEAVQAALWRPAMAAEEAMLGGGFGRGDEDAGPYLVATLWSSIAAHEVYARERLPALRERARVGDDVTRLAGGRTPLEPRWTVTPAG